MRTPSLVGLPTVILASFALMAWTTSSAMAVGTMARRMAVHFWPALTVISETTPLTNRSNSGSTVVTSGPRIEQLSESASTPSWTPPCKTEGCWRRVAPVAADPVNATESCAPSWSSRPSGLPHNSCSDPSGRMPESNAQLRADSDLSHFEYFALAMLSEAPERTLRMTDLAQRSNATLPRLSHVVKRLEAKGLVERFPCQDDKRATNSRLTERGWAVVVQAAPGHVDTVRRVVLDSLTSEQVRQLHAIGNALLTTLDPRGRLTGLYGSDA